MTTERQACGLGSFIPMNCRGRAEAFARRLHSRLQSLGRAGSGDGTSPADETSWLTKKPEVTNHQPRLSSSTDSDIYYDFDIDCESPGSPVEETLHSETLPDCFVNKSRAFHCPPRTQYSSESGCVLSPSAVTGTSPDSDSSDGLYFDPESSDTEVSCSYQNCKRGHNQSEYQTQHESSPEIDTLLTTHTNASSSSESGSENVPRSKMNGHASSLKQEPTSVQEEGKRIGRRGFRNAAGFRIFRLDESIKNDKNELMSEQSKSESVTLDANATCITKNNNSFSSEGSTADEYFECNSPKTPESVSDYLNSLCLQDSGYPNTAESSRCNSQNETLHPTSVTVESNYSVALPEDSTEDTGCTQCSNVSNENVSIISECSNEISLDVENTSLTSNQSLNTDVPVDVSENCDSQSEFSCLEEVKFEPENHLCNSGDSDSTQSSENVVQSPDSCCSSSESLYSSTLNRPSKLTIEYPSLSLQNDNSICETTKEKKQTEDEDDDDDPNQPTPRVRRCSSLKTGKTPPDTPGRKKIVRFADVLGLDLADVRTFLDEVPKVPRSAYEDLQCGDLPDSSSLSLTEGALNEVLRPICISGNLKPDRCLIPLFQQPGGQPDFMDCVREGLVCLENAVVTDTVSYSITGTVRVRNLDFHKSVHIRYTLDGWKTFADLQATYVPNSCDGFSDKFSFMLYAHTLQVGQRLEFAIRFQCRGAQYWDSNHGANYVFQCLPPAGHSSTYTPIPISPDETFPTSFY